MVALLHLLHPVHQSSLDSATFATHTPLQTSQQLLTIRHPLAT